MLSVVRLSFVVLVDGCEPAPEDQTLARGAREILPRSTMRPIVVPIGGGDESPPNDATDGSYRTPQTDLMEAVTTLGPRSPDIGTDLGVRGGHAKRSARAAGAHGKVLDGSGGGEG